MAKFTRGFFGRGNAARDPRLPPGPVRHRTPVAGADRRGHARRSTPPTWTFTVEGLVEQPDHVDLGRDARAPAVDVRGRHPLRHDVVEVRHDVRRASPSTRCSRRPVRSPTRRTCSRSPTPATRRTCRSPTSPAARRGWRGRPTASRCRAITAAGPAARAAPLLLEERQVGRRPPAARPRRARLLGAQRLPRPRRPLARAALPGRLTAWPEPSPGRRATVHRHPRRDAAGQDLPPRASTRRPATAPGQHYVVRLTAPDGYTASRSYSVASAPDGTGEFELTVERLDDGEVSTFLHDVVEVGDELEVRGPIGGWFVWDGDTPGAAASAAAPASCRSWRCCAWPGRPVAPTWSRWCVSVRSPDRPLLRRRAPAAPRRPCCHHPGARPGSSPPGGRITADDLAAPPAAATRPPTCAARPASPTPPATS